MNFYQFLDASKKQDLDAFINRFFNLKQPGFSMVLRLMTNSSLLSASERSKLSRFSGSKCIDIRAIALTKDFINDIYYELEDFIKPLGHIRLDKAPLMPQSLYIDLSIKPIDDAAITAFAASKILNDNVSTLTAIRSKSTDKLAQILPRLSNMQSYVAEAVDDAMATNKSLAACIKAEYLPAFRQSASKILSIVSQLCKMTFRSNKDYVIISYADGFDIVYDTNAVSKDLFHMLQQIEQLSQQSVGSFCFVKKLTKSQSNFIHCPATFYRGQSVSIYR